MNATQTTVVTRGEATRVRGAEMVALIGSEKQIAWAAEIRDQKIADIREFLAKFVAANGPADQLEQIKKIANWVGSRTEAKFWIDNREYKGESIMKLYKSMQGYK